ncbi:MAG: hypothetical protein JXA42_11135 [Anaerolineales bacterium]|nr:hypothetical protein [Anaerolineales bacterium]
MAADKDELMPQLKALKTTNLSPLVRMAGGMMPRMIKAFLSSLNEKQKSAFDKMLPVDGKKKIFLHLLETPTPPIVIGMAQPPNMSTLSENDVKQQKIKGIRLKVDDIQVLAGGQTLGTMLKFAWRLKGQIFTLLAIAWMFVPLLLMGPAELKDFMNKMATRFKPLLDLLPRPKK